ncbi:hypothetical protein [uncultured Planktomarina sp.]|uniref:hypothetical protein n=1 Tax=uncultured Planktomarina sp. TaxID=1538529 RepID=UPI003260ED78
MSGAPAQAGGLFKALGKKPKEERPRQPEDFERTPKEGTRAFLAAEGHHLKRFPHIWEAAAGDGAMSREIAAMGFPVVSSDLVDRGMGATIRDFYDFSEPLSPCLVTNPPYCEVNWTNGKGRWITHAMEELGVEYMALLLSWNWPGAAGLGQIWGKYPPKRVYLMRFRLDFSGKGSPPQLNAWFVWERGFTGNPELLMLDHGDPRQGEWDV